VIVVVLKKEGRKEGRREGGKKGGEKERKKEGRKERRKTCYFSKLKSCLAAWSNFNVSIYR
jgi:hypothetical protein